MPVTRCLESIGSRTGRRIPAQSRRARARPVESRAARSHGSTLRGGGIGRRAGQPQDASLDHRDAARIRRCAEQDGRCARVGGKRRAEPRLSFHDLPLGRVERAPADHRKPLAAVRTVSAYRLRAVRRAPGPRHRLPHRDRRSAREQRRRRRAPSAAIGHRPRVRAGDGRPEIVRCAEVRHDSTCRRSRIRALRLARRGGGSARPPHLSAARVSGITSNCTARC